jgi:ubiquinone/menaquinone biosynthesis C-methylase UbiE
MTRRLVTIGILIAAGVVALGWFSYRAIAARRVAQETDRLAAILRLGPDSRVADVGAGNGAFSRELASRVVPSGHVFATEIDAGAVDALRTSVTRTGLKNVTVIQARPDATGLPDGCCDAAFLRGVYHHVTQPVETNLSLAEALRPQGRLAIIDFEPSWLLSLFVPVRDVPSNRGGHGVPPAVVVAELEHAGLTLIERIDEWPGGQYCLVFQKPA